MFKKIFILCLVIAGSFPFIGKSLLYAENKFSSLQADTVIESPGMGKTMGKFFIKGKKVRLETNSTDAAGTDMVTLYDGQKAYVYFPAQNMAMVTPAPQVEQQMPTPNAEFNKEIVGQEAIDGKLCDIYQLKDAKGSSYKVWVARDIEFPVKSEAAGVKTYYKNIQVNVSLDDRLFELPQGTQVQDMGGLMHKQQTGTSR